MQMACIIVNEAFIDANLALVPLILQLLLFTFRLLVLNISMFIVTYLRCREFMIMLKVASV